MLLISAHKLIQKLCALKIQTVHRFVQKQQLGPQGKRCNQMGFFPIAGGQFLQQNMGIVFKMKAIYQPGHVR